MLLQRICRHFLKMRFLRWTESSKAAGDAALLAALFQLLQGQYPGQYDDNGAYDGEEGVGAHGGLVTAAQRQAQAPRREGENARVLEREHHIGGGNEPKGVLGDHRDVDEDDATLKRRQRERDHKREVTNARSRVMGISMRPASHPSPAICSPAVDLGLPAALWSIAASAR
jgi:hypothetical protein